MSGGGKKSKAPKMPSAEELAAQQTASNEQTATSQAMLNMVNTNTPYGSIRYSPQAGAYKDSKGRPMQFDANVTLAPEQQRLLDLENQAGIGLGELGVRHLGQIGQGLEGPLDFNGQFGGVPGMDGGRNALADALFSRLEPQIERDRQRMDTQLANQGITAGSEAYTRAQGDMERNIADTRTSTMISADAEQSRQMQARQQAISELLQQRSVPINEITALMSGSQVQMPGQVQTPQTAVGGTDVMGGTLGKYNADMAAYTGGQDRQAQMLGSLFQMGGALGSAAIMPKPMFSDRRVKRDVRRIGEACGLPVYSFRYVWSPVEHVGFMADEVARVMPAAVIERGGLKMVDYRMVMGR
jgi:hypothetical protein